MNKNGSFVPLVSFVSSVVKQTVGLTEPGQQATPPRTRGSSRWIIGRQRRPPIPSAPPRLCASAL